VLWATRRKIRISRAATAWFVKRFVDPEATFYFGTEDEVLERERGGAVGFHCRGTRYPKLDAEGLTPIEALIRDHRLTDPAILRFAAIIRDADGPAGQERCPEAAGIRMATVAFPEICDDDQVIVDRSAFLYEALFAALRKVAASGRSPGGSPGSNT
jgi:hypothetical protein